MWQGFCFINTVYSKVCVSLPNIFLTFSIQYLLIVLQSVVYKCYYKSVYPLLPLLQYTANIFYRFECVFFVKFPKSDFSGYIRLSTHLSHLLCLISYIISLGFVHFINQSVAMFIVWLVYIYLNQSEAKEHNLLCSVVFQPAQKLELTLFTEIFITVSIRCWD